MRTFTVDSLWPLMLSILLALTLSDSSFARCGGRGNVFNNAANNVFGNVFDDFNNNNVFGGLQQVPIFSGNGGVDDIFNQGNFGNFGGFNGNGNFNGNFNGNLGGFNQVPIFGGNGNFGNGNFGNFGNGNFGDGQFAGQLGNSLFNNAGTILLRDRNNNPIQVVGDGSGNILDTRGTHVSFHRSRNGTPLDKFGDVLGVEVRRNNNNGRTEAILVGFDQNGQVVNRPKINGRFIRLQAANVFNNFGNLGNSGNFGNFGNNSISPIAAFSNPNDPSQELQPRNPGNFGFIDDADVNPDTH